MDKAARAALLTAKRKDNASENIADYVADLLRQGRAKEVTDDLMAQADPQRLHQHYTSGNTGTDLPMDYASRMARAAAMGFRDKSYHGTPHLPLDKLKPSEFGAVGRGVYLTKSPVTATDYARGWGQLRPNDTFVQDNERHTVGGNIVPVLTKGELQPFRDWTENKMDNLKEQGLYGSGFKADDAASNTAEQAGFSGIQARNENSTVFDPTNIRSQFARFDPRLDHLAHLSASTGGAMDFARHVEAVHRAGGQIAPSKYLPNVPRQVHAGGGRAGYAVGGRENEKDDLWWHGSPSGDLRGGTSGLHLGTKAAALDALRSRIGVPADGSMWDGTREYGKTLLAGQNTLNKMGKYLITGHNADAPMEDYYPHQHPKGMPWVGNRVPVDPTWKPFLRPFKIVGKMNNDVHHPHSDRGANASMKASLTKGNAKNGYYYKNDGEDEGSISAVVPNGSHVVPADNPNDPDITKAGGGRIHAEDGGKMELRSRAAEAIRNQAQLKGSVDQLLAVAAKGKGVKQAELANAGRPSGNIISKEELARHFEDALPDVGVERLGGRNDGLSPEEEKEFSSMTAPGAPYPTGAAMERYRHLSKKLNVAPTRYGQYALSGGENYREHLLHLPENLPNQNPREIELREQQEEASKNRDYEGLDRIGAELEKIRSAKQNFRSSHWDTPNVLAHVRMKDRDKGKTLHVEEVQSDWGQEGRERGFYDIAKPFEVFHTGTGQTVHATDNMGEAKAKAEQLGPQYDYARQDNDKVPRGPYVGNTQQWTDLALKHALTEAAKGGHDRVVFSPGEANADLYGQRNPITEANFTTNTRYPDAFGQLHTTRVDGKENKSIDIRDEAHLKSLLGKKNASAILAKPLKNIGNSNVQVRSISEPDMHLGGHGMVDYYNNIVHPSALKLLQQHDPSIKPESYDLPNGYKGFSLPMTDTARQSILKNGFGAFKRGGMVGKEEGGALGEDDGITAYHGSPHSFDSFDIAHLGTGEGAQAYGHGLYFAGNEGVAKAYRDQLSGGNIEARNYFKDGKILPNIGEAWQSAHDAAKAAANIPPDHVRAIATQVQNWVSQGKKPETFLRYNQPPRGYEAAYKAAADAWSGVSYKKNKGHMYKVKLNVKPHELLDWDKPLSEQHPNVQAAIKATGVDTGARKWENGADMGNGSRLVVTPHPDLPDEEEFTKYEMQLPSGSRVGLNRNDVARVLGDENLQPNGLTGAQIHQRLVDMGNRHGAIGEHLRAGNPMKRGDKWASEALMEQGLKGIKYRDARSRDMSDGDPTHNYVMFHHDPVQVVDKYEYGGTVGKEEGGEVDDNQPNNVVNLGFKRAMKNVMSDEPPQHVQDVLNHVQNRFEASRQAYLEAKADGAFDRLPFGDKYRYKPTPNSAPMEVVGHRMMHVSRWGSKEPPKLVYQDHYPVVDLEPVGQPAYTRPCPVELLLNNPDKYEFVSGKPRLVKRKGGAVEDALALTRRFSKDGTGATMALKPKGK